MKPVTKFEYWFGRTFEFTFKGIHLAGLMYLGYMAVMYTLFRVYYPYYTIAIIAGMAFVYLQYQKIRYWEPLNPTDMLELLQLVKAYPEAGEALNQRISKQSSVLYRDLLELKKQYKGANA